MAFQRSIASARDRFTAAGIDPNEAALDAELLVREVLGWTRERLLVARHNAAPEGFAERFEALVRRRERREPVAYILGRREFWTLDFEVSPAVLIPRPETELLVEQTIDCARLMTASGFEGRDLRIIDIGTGSGCVAIALARELPSANFVATDVSGEALDVARRNARRHGVDARIEFIEATGIPEDQAAAIVVSNPPYVPVAERSRLPPEVRDYEPPAALFAGPDGLDAIRLLLEQANEKLQGGLFVFEFGFGQGPAIEKLIEGLSRLRLVRIAADLQRIPRVAAIAPRGAMAGPVREQPHRVLGEKHDHG
ncbi:MAG: peptide chain release factor N(5)-glutamine methyltransferase [Acidobacteria bacterium]|nr:peptide chain release factor N(5)-glutamine methyltransferase [Acidobacteriota bacterium]